MKTKNQSQIVLTKPELSYIISWLRRNNLYENLKWDLGIKCDIDEKNSDHLSVQEIEKLSSESKHSWVNCIASYNQCSSYVEFRKKHLKEYLWLRRNKLLKQFQVEINYTKTDSITHASKYRGRGIITYPKCINDWNDGNFIYKSDYYRCFSGNLKYLQRNNLLDKFLDEVLTKNKSK